MGSEQEEDARSVGASCGGGGGGLMDECITFEKTGGWDWKVGDAVDEVNKLAKTLLVVQAPLLLWLLELWLLFLGLQVLLFLLLLLLNPTTAAGAAATGDGDDFSIAGGEALSCRLV